MTDLGKASNAAVEQRTGEGGVLIGSSAEPVLEGGVALPLQISKSTLPLCGGKTVKREGGKTYRKSFICLQLLALKPTVSKSVVLG